MNYRQRDLDALIRNVVATRKALDSELGGYYRRNGIAASTLPVVSALEHASDALDIVIAALRRLASED